MTDIRKKGKRPIDANQLAKFVVDVATDGDADDGSKALSERGKKGGVVGGQVRANKLTPEQRVEVARVAASSRWKDNDS